ncbi:glycosyltransferase family 4 protein [Uliginosibacterium sp. sgz301328]|uniref:glycosyltransferase family 4 protein n=1 Tax=Uliginosibacterium sp. sgz301328 TaxID=3243764 RepID=UPI00359F032E
MPEDNVERTMKLAFISEYEEIGGGESNLMNLCEELSKTHEVVLFCSGKLYTHATARGISCRQFSLGGRRWLRFLPLLSFPGTLRRELAGFDLVHAYSVNILPRLFMLGRPVVWTTHGYWERPSGGRARMIDLIVRRVVAVSTGVYDAAQFSADKKCKIFLGTSLPHCELAGQSSNRHDLRLVCVGRFQDIKGQDVLLEALGACARAQPGRHFILELVGDVNGNSPADFQYKARLEALADTVRAPNLSIDFKGFQPNPTQFMRNADLVVIPSRYESFSMVAIEALACGKPVIAPDIGGPKDIIDSADVGLRFEPGNVSSLAQAILDMAAGLSRYCPETCARRAQDFSVARQAQEHVLMYEEILSA